MTEKDNEKTIEEEIAVHGEYGAEQIQVLEGLEAVRKRPSMYIGSISARGLHHLVYEVIDNSIDEALAGYCDHILVEIGEDNSITVVDNGRGIPVEMHKIGKPAIEVVMTILHAGGKFGDGGYKVSGGLHGVGVSCVNALSRRMEVEVKKDGKIYGIEFSKGKTVRPLYVKGECDAKDTGTSVHFWPDDTIFTETVYSYETLKHRIRELAFLNKGVKIELKDDRSGADEIFHYEGGIISFVEYINKGKEAIFNTPIYVEGERQDTIVEVAMQYTDAYTENIYTFVNNINTEEGGTHLAGLKQALTRSINDYARKNGIVLKGDLPIGVNRTSVEAWMEPKYFNMNGQAGAPPDDFSVNGQNWGFPTYNWDMMEKDNFSWWKKRFRKLEDYFDSFRIDHILGFFRIWEVPSEYVQGLCGHFNPALPLTPNEIEQYGLDFNEARLTTPHINREFLPELFGDQTEEVIGAFLAQSSSRHFVLKPFCDTQRKVEALFAGKTDEASLRIKKGLFAIANEVLFLRDPREPDKFHPRISASQSYLYRELSASDQYAFDQLYWNFFYHRHNEFWKAQAFNRLTPLVGSTNMLVCGRRLRNDPGIRPRCDEQIADIQSGNRTYAQDSAT